ncbi:MAG: squalene/phytoene synthase family protein [Phycisphaerales bacterium JB039]
MIDLDALLEETSRTFALSIPLLPEPLRRQIGLGYLVFRVADTFEDEGDWPVAQRIAALRLIGPALLQPDGAEAAEFARHCAAAEVDHAGYRRLLQSWPQLAAEFGALDPAARGVICAHLQRSAAGMCEFLLDRPSSMDELRRYCYAVAGIVGELCTELFVLHSPQLGPVRAELMARAAPFGEGLQLVNILRDAQVDALHARHFVPRSVSRDQLIERAGSNLDKAIEYIDLLQRRGAGGAVAFNALNLGLAVQTLSLVDRDGAGARLDGGRVFALLESIAEMTARGASVLPLLRQLSEASHERV